MACFLVTSAAAVVTAVARHSAIGREKKISSATDSNQKLKSGTKHSDYLKYLELAFLTGSFILAGEHFIHGEISFVPPFLTACKSSETLAEMWHEMLTVGVAMTATIFFVWLVGVIVHKALGRSKTSNMEKQSQSLV